MIAIVALQQGHQVVEAVFIRIVGAEVGRLADHLPIAEFTGDCPRLATLPVAAGLDAEQVVAAAAVVLAHDRFTPTGFQCGLGYQHGGVDTDTRGRLLGHGQQGGDKIIG
ncbi:hypothetical protein D9M73_257420 [compost metagenome]